MITPGGHEKKGKRGGETGPARVSTGKSTAPYAGRNGNILLAKNGYLEKGKPVGSMYQNLEGNITAVEVLKRYIRGFNRGTRKGGGPLPNLCNKTRSANIDGFYIAI